MHRGEDDQVVTAAMQLTRGRVYTFTPSAVDNRTDEKDLKYEIRVSTDGGVSFGPPKEVKGSLSLPIYENYSGIAFEVKAIDNSGRSATARFNAGGKSPQIVFSKFYTTTAANPEVPADIEEMTRANICAEIGGDADLVTSMEMRVFDKSYTVDLPAVQDGVVKGCLSYLNPKLKDLSGDQVPVRVRVGYKFSGSTFKDFSYTLWLDKTPPDIAIVSPPDGSRIPMGEQTSVLLKSFDKYGIEKIEKSINGGAWQEVADPNMFTFTATDLNPVTVKVRASDPNGNISLDDGDSTVTLTPYDPSAGEPKVEILAPKDGSSFHEGETVPLEVVLRNLGTAQLFMDVGGNETDPRNPAPVTITRNAKDPERFSTSVVLPKVARTWWWSCACNRAPSPRVVSST